MTTPAAEDEFTELVDADFPRVDLVGKGANGFPRFLIAKSDAAGLLEPDFVRDLIAKAEPDTSGRERVTMPSGVTLTGSPADIAAFIHKAAERAGQPEDVAKAKLSSAELNDLPDSAFAFIEDGGKKDSEGKTTPRSLRHFAIHDKAHADNAASRIAQGAEFGDKAKPKVEAAQRKFGEKVSKESGVPDTVTKDAAMGPDLDAGIDGMDPTVPLAAAEMDAPGDPTDPGSPAWEAIDAATACKWTSILARARAAIGMLAEREMIEAVSADPGDGENACDLTDACCAIDFAIGVLAPFAVAEQSEADCGAAAMAVAKAMAGDLSGPLGTIEALAQVRKAGRVLSASNEAAIRGAADSLNKVLMSLPAAPVADETVTKEAAVAADQTSTEAPEASPAAVAKEDAAASVEATNAALAGATDVQLDLKPGLSAAEVTGARITKADGGDGGEPPCLVYDGAGKALGIVDMSAITAIQGAAPVAPAMKDGDAPDAPAADPAPADAAPCPDPGDMTPQPAAEAGVPAGEDKVAKADPGETPTSSAELESIITKAVAAALDARGTAEGIAKADAAALGAEVETLKARLATVEEQPAAPRVFTNGAVPPPGQLRGQDRAQQGAPTVDVAKAAELKGTLYRGTAPEQNVAANAMQEMAIAQLSAIHSGRA